MHRHERILLACFVANLVVWTIGSLRPTVEIKPQSFLFIGLVLPCLCFWQSLLGHGRMISPYKDHLALFHRVSAPRRWRLGQLVEPREERSQLSFAREYGVC